MRPMSTSRLMFTQRSQCHLRPALQMLAFTYMLVLTNGFNTRNSVSQHVRSGHFVAPKCPSRALCPSRQDFNRKSQGASVSASLFRQRLQQEQRQQQAIGNSYRLQMTTTDSSNDVSNNRNPFVKVWLWLRKLLAKIWVSGSSYSTLFLLNIMHFCFDWFIILVSSKHAFA